jgi:predicted O-linked N-acetylglucosamine transferase (SPINDLY family)
MSSDWLPQVKEERLSGDFNKITRLYEQMIEKEPDEVSYYWYLGLAHLLSGEESEAQTVWWFVLGQVALEDNQDTQYLEELVAVLMAEASHQNSINQLRLSWLIRRHIWELMPEKLDNLLLLLQIEIDIDGFKPETLLELKAIDVLGASESLGIDSSLVLETLKKVIYYPEEVVIDFARACILHAESLEYWVESLIDVAQEVRRQLRRPDHSVKITNFCLELQPDSLLALEFLPRFYQEARCFPEAIAAAKRFHSLCPNQALKVTGASLVLKTMLSSGAWTDIIEAVESYKQELLELFKLNPLDLKIGILSFLTVQTGVFAYLQDNLAENRSLQNQASRLFLSNLKSNSNIQIPFYQPALQAGKKLKIGYVGHTFTSHSVGWLCRWLFLHHNREQFEIYIYLIGLRQEDQFFQDWILPNVDSVTALNMDMGAIAQKIKADEINILVDIDSYTLDATCAVMAIKPAPVQVTWLGADASGLETIDYFIADPYVLPESAQEHYQETIWRLPQTYLAIDGFELDVPSLSRRTLDIPDDAIVYFSSQVASKRHPETVKLQLQIIKAVTNSYYLIKGLGDDGLLKQLFYQLADEIGLEHDRMRFLPWASSEYVHRANLQIADVVLDTYPYNGATTTLETLWAGIPLVTRVGETFSARNSYTFLRNVGITEGIAHSAKEYVEWGIRFGTNEELRQQVAWELRQSRHTSPLWNTQQFARDMETAYQQMWQQYIGGGG